MNLLTSELKDLIFARLGFPVFQARNAFGFDRDAGDTVAWTHNIGHVIIDEISIEIGGAIIDKHYGIWYTIYNKLTQVYEKSDRYDVMIGNTYNLTNLAASIPVSTIYVPLIFWFNRNPGLALPLVSLMYHDVKVNVSFRPAVESYVTGSNLPLTNIPSLRDVFPCTLITSSSTHQN
ncbi:UNVERIFIED_CONTAM: hypothetical protein HDU68_004866, partial [Siphonaria sp. JEL0065]